MNKMVCKGLAEACEYAVAVEFYFPFYKRISIIIGLGKLTFR